MKVLTLLFLFTLFTLKSFAEGNYTFTMSFSVTAQVQNTNVITTSSMTFVPTVTHGSINTRTLLRLIAAGEYAEGKYTTNTFPAGTRLVFFTNPSNFTNSYYEVIDKNGNQLVDVTNLLAFEPENGVSLYSYKSANSTGVYNPLVREYVGVTTFDDTSAGGTTKFTLTQNMEATVIQKISTKAVLTDSATLKISAGMGTATFNGLPAVLTSSPTIVNSPKLAFNLD